MDAFRLALAQLTPTLFEKDRNLARAEEVIRRAGTQGASAVIFPELYLTGYALDGRAAELAEPADGPSVRRAAQLAGDCHTAIVMGFAELDPDGRRVYDAAFSVDRDGRLCGTYRKVHLFHDEKDLFTPGDRLRVFDFGLGPAGLLICYDLEFPEAARSLALQGAGWIAVCTGNMTPNQHLQEIYIQSRAAENRLWVAAANRTGREAGIDFFGGSAAADPGGVLVAQAGSDEQLLLADLDLGRSALARQNSDYLQDRRPDLYRAGPS